MNNTIQGLYQNGKIVPLEDIPFKEDRKVLIIFLDEQNNDSWDQIAAEDFLKGYSDQDCAYDKL